MSSSRRFARDDRVIGHRENGIAEAIRSCISCRYVTNYVLMADLLAGWLRKFLGWCCAVRGIVLVSLLLFSACKSKTPEQTCLAAKVESDSPALPKAVEACDTSFHSAAMERDMAYRVVRPAHLAPDERLPTVYLLPGGGSEGFRQWLKYSHVARFAERRLILVMPEAGYPFYANSFSAPKDRYEDYLTADLIADVERRFPVVPRASSRAFVGVSLGGFGAIKLALAHPHLVVFAGAISAPVDDASRKHDPEEQLHSGVFGPWGSHRRRHNDLFFLATTANVSDAPYIYLACGEKENNIRSNRQFDTLLTKRKFAHEFHAVPEGHDWIAWERQLPDVFRSLLQHMETANQN